MFKDNFRYFTWYEENQCAVTGCLYRLIRNRKGDFWSKKNCHLNTGTFVDRERRRIKASEQQALKAENGVEARVVEDGGGRWKDEERWGGGVDNHLQSSTDGIKQGTWHFSHTTQVFLIIRYRTGLRKGGYYFWKFKLSSLSTSHIFPGIIELLEIRRNLLFCFLRGTPPIN